MGNTMLSMGKNTDEAIRYIERALELNPNEPKFLFALAGAQRELGRYGQAMTTLEAIKRLDPDYGKSASSKGARRRGAGKKRGVFRRPPD